MNIKLKINVTKDDGLISEDFCDAVNKSVCESIPIMLNFDSKDTISKVVTLLNDTTNNKIVYSKATDCYTITTPNDDREIPDTVLYTLNRTMKSNDPNVTGTLTVEDFELLRKTIKDAFADQKARNKLAKAGNTDSVCCDDCLCASKCDAAIRASSSTS